MSCWATAFAFGTSYTGNILQWRWHPSKDEAKWFTLLETSLTQLPTRLNKESPLPFLPRKMHHITSAVCGWSGHKLSHSYLGMVKSYSRKSPGMKNTLVATFGWCNCRSSVYGDTLIQVGITSKDDDGNADEDREVTFREVCQWLCRRVSVTDTTASKTSSLASGGGRTHFG